MIIITFFWHVIALITLKAIFLRQANNTQQEIDCQTSDMYNNGTSHVSGPGPFIWQARAVHVSGPAPPTSQTDERRRSHVGGLAPHSRHVGGAGPLTVPLTWAALEDINTGAIRTNLNNATTSEESYYLTKL